MHWQTLIEAKSLWNRIEAFSIDIHQIKLILGQGIWWGREKSPFSKENYSSEDENLHKNNCN